MCIQFSYDKCLLFLKTSNNQYENVASTNFYTNKSLSSNVA